MHDAICFHTRGAFDGRECVKSIQRVLKEPDQFEIKQENSKLDLQKHHWLKYAYVRMQCGKKNSHSRGHKFKIAGCFLEHKNQRSRRLEQKSPFALHLISFDVILWVLFPVDVRLKKSDGPGTWTQSYNLLMSVYLIAFSGSFSLV